jgi:hypothetical protein
MLIRRQPKPKPPKKGHKLSDESKRKMIRWFNAGDRRQLLRGPAK